MTLLPFGGAGALFGCQLADALGMGTIVVPPHPGALSALGLASAPERADVLASFHRSVDGLEPRALAQAFAPLVAEGARQNPGGALLKYADCRFAGQGYEVTVPVEGDAPERIRTAFLTAHRERFGHAGGGLAVEIVNLRVAVLREGPLPRFAGEKRSERRPIGQRSLVVRGKRVTGSVWALDQLARGVTLQGPAILAGGDATALVEAGWCGTVHPSGAVLLAHHSDVGGMQAGSMPAGARELFAEGVVVPPLRLTQEVERFLLANVRTPEARRADLAAQRAAVERGADGLRALAARHGWAVLCDAARDLQEYAERRAREALARLEATGLTATDWLEGDGVDDRDLAIHVRVDIRDGAFHADFTGTAPAARGNVNCPLAVARSAVLFVVRTLLPEDVPTNGGVGVGKWRGGDGVVREFEALAPMDASFLSERRRHAPSGVGGGAGGAPGRTLVNGAPLPPKLSTRLAAGDVVRIETPGGGGWGQPEPGGGR